MKITKDFINARVNKEKILGEHSNPQFIFNIDTNQIEISDPTRPINPGNRIANAISLSKIDLYTSDKINNSNGIIVIPDKVNYRFAFVGKEMYEETKDIYEHYKEL